MRHTPFDRTTLANYDIRRHVPDAILETIDRPHPHEGEGNPPCWIVWDVRNDCAPQIDTICNSPDSAVYHYGAIMEEVTMGRGKRVAYVERVPMNHRFASSVAYLFDGPIAYGQPGKRRVLH